MAEGGQHPMLATKGKARAAASLDKLSPGDEGHGQPATNAKALKDGVHVEKGFKLSADDKGVDFVRVIKNGVVVYSGTKQAAQETYKALGDFLKK